MFKFINPRSVVFVNPDYHCSFFYRDALREIGWRADILVSPSYPETLLYSENDILTLPRWCLATIGRVALGGLLWHFYTFLVVLRFKFVFIYGAVDQFSMVGTSIKAGRRPFESFSLLLALFKLFGKKVIVLPSGCLEEESQANFRMLDEGNVCGNCGYAGTVCNDHRNNRRFEVVRRYSDLVVGTSSMDSSQFQQAHFRYKSIDLKLWSPELIIPEEFVLPATRNFRILHGFVSKGREHSGKNIKGSPHVVSAVERLQQEGYPVELMYVTDVASKDMRFLQAQSDIVVEQLIYGWWGSTGVETMALGKPVVCYLRASWKEFFLNTYPDYDELPIVEANPDSIYSVLKNLLEDDEMRKRAGERSREFAESHFDPATNGPELAKRLLNLL